MGLIWELINAKDARNNNNLKQRKGGGGDNIKGQPPPVEILLTNTVSVKYTH